MEAAVLQFPTRAAPPTVVIALRREMDPEVFHGLLGAALKRIRAFAGKFDTDADGRILARAVEFDLVQDDRDRTFMVLVAANRTGVVGHLLAHVEDYYGKRLVSVMQLEIDRSARIAKDDLLSALASVAQWGKEHGATKLKAAALTERHARRLERSFGFDREMITLGREIG